MAERLQLLVDYNLVDEARVENCHNSDLQKRLVQNLEFLKLAREHLEKRITFSRETLQLWTRIDSNILASLMFILDQRNEARLDVEQSCYLLEHFIGADSSSSPLETIAEQCSTLLEAWAVTGGNVVSRKKQKTSYPDTSENADSEKSEDPWDDFDYLEDEDAWLKTLLSPLRIKEHRDYFEPLMKSFIHQVKYTHVTDFAGMAQKIYSYYIGSSEFPVLALISGYLDQQGLSREQQRSVIKEIKACFLAAFIRKMILEADTETRNKTQEKRVAFINKILTNPKYAFLYDLMSTLDEAQRNAELIYLCRFDRAIFKISEWIPARRNAEFFLSIGALLEGSNLYYTTGSNASQKTNCRLSMVYVMQGKPAKKQNPKAACRADYTLPGGNKLPPAELWISMLKAVTGKKDVTNVILANGEVCKALLNQDNNLDRHLVGANNIFEHTLLERNAINDNSLTERPTVSLMAPPTMKQFQTSAAVPMEIESTDSEASESHFTTLATNLAISQSQEDNEDESLNQPKPKKKHAAKRKISSVEAHHLQKVPREKKKKNRKRF